jgi:WD40 repeat protein
MTKKHLYPVFIFVYAILSGCNFSDTPEQTWTHSGLGSFDAKLSPDGVLALVATVDHGTHLWDLSLNQSKFMFTDQAGEKTPHQVLAFKPPIAVTAYQNQCVIWNTDNAQSLAFWQMPGNILSTDLTKDGRFALVGMDNYQAHLIDLQTGYTFKIFQHADNINSVDFSDNEQYALIGSDDTAARLWDLNSGELVQQWFHQKKITFVAISPKSKYAVISSSQNITEIKDIKSGETISTLALNSFPLNLISNQTTTITAVSFSSDEKYIYTGSPPRHIHKWSIEDGSLVKKWVLPNRKSKSHSAIPFSIVTVNDEKLVIEASNGQGYTYNLKDKA